LAFLGSQTAQIEPDSRGFSVRKMQLQKDDDLGYFLEFIDFSFFSQVGKCGFCLEKCDDAGTF